MESKMFKMSINDLLFLKILLFKKINSKIYPTFHIISLNKFIIYQTPSILYSSIKSVCFAVRFAWMDVWKI